jgi:hypothetical protein
MSEKIITSNRSAYHEYHILETFEAGIELTGTEVKSARDGRVNLKDAYAQVRDGEAWLHNAHISPYSHGNRENHDPTRSRRLLLNRKEIERLRSGTDARPDPPLLQGPIDQVRAGGGARQEALRQARDRSPPDAGPRSPRRHQGSLARGLRGNE